MECPNIDRETLVNYINAGKVAHVEREKLNEAADFVRSCLTAEQQELVFSKSPLLYTESLSKPPFGSELAESIKSHGLNPDNQVLVHVDIHSEYTKKALNTLPKDKQAILKDTYQYFLTPITPLF